METVTRLELLWMKKVIIFNWGLQIYNNDLILIYIKTAWKFVL